MLSWNMENLDLRTSFTSFYSLMGLVDVLY